MYKQLKDLVISAFKLVVALAAIIGFFKLCFHGSVTTGIGPLTFVCGLAVLFLGDNILLRLRWVRMSKYGQVLPIINASFAKIHDLWKQEKLSSYAIELSCSSFCTLLAHAFSTIAGTPCSVCIKVITALKQEGQQERLAVITMARDEFSSQDRGSGKGDVVHWVDENTDFSQIFSKIGMRSGRYFFSNQLPFLREYQNTSFNIEDRKGNHSLPDFSVMNLWSVLKRYWRWTLPYKSTIVVPICPGIADKRNRDNLVGYICVDATKLLVFRKLYDVDLLSGAADGLHNTISRYIELVEEEGTHGTSQ
jgi:hypothetical protein